MSDAGKLLDELWPSGEPPLDMTERVMAAMRGEAPARAPRRRGRWLVGAAALAAAAVVAVVAVRRRAGELDGELVAQARQTVDIGGRAAAALEPGAALTWSVRGPRVRVAQPRGSVFYRVEHGGPFRVTTPAGAIEVTGTCFRVNVPAGGPTLVTVLEGAVKVEGDRGQLALAAGQTASLGAGRAPELIEPPSVDELSERADRAEARLEELEGLLAAQPKEAARPAPLVLPWSSRLTVYGPPPEKVSLSLPPGRRPSTVEVARDPEFKQRVFLGVTSGAFVTVPAPRQGELHWRIAGGSGSAHARFLPEPRPAAAHPHNEVSDSRDSTTVYFQGPAPELTLTFTGQGAHRVRLFRAGALEVPVFSRDVDGARCDIPAGTLPEGRYIWSAQPLEDDTLPRYRKLEIVRDSNQTALAIDHPVRARRAGRDTVVGGSAPLGAQLFVNGRPASLDAGGRFTARVAASSHLLVFRLRAPSGDESYWLRRLR